MPRLRVVVAYTPLKCDCVIYRSDVLTWLWQTRACPGAQMGGSVRYRAAPGNFFQFLALHHGPPNVDVLDRHGINCQRVLFQNCEISELSGLDTAAFVLQPMRNLSGSAISGAMAGKTVPKQ